MVAISDELRGACTDVFALTPDVAVVYFDVSGTTDGASFSRPVINVSRFGRDGLVDRAELFPPEAVAEALALFDQWTSRPPSHTRAPAPTTASRFMERWAAAMAVADHTALANLLAPGAAVDDRRPIVGIAGEISAEAFVLQGDLYGQPVSHEMVATRG